MNSALKSFLRKPVAGSGAIALLVDLTVCPATVWVAFYLRLGHVIGLSPEFYRTSAIAVILAIPVLTAFGLYRVVLRHATPDLLWRIAYAILVYGAFFGLIVTGIGLPGVPRTIGLIQPILLLLGVGCSRAVVGYWFGFTHRRRHVSKAQRQILIYGAGAAGRQLASAIRADGAFKLVGFVDDASYLHGRSITGVRVFPPNELPEIVGTRQVEEVLLALPSAPRWRRKEIIKSLYDLEVRVLTLPGLMDLATGRVRVSDLRPIEIDDLLGRTIVPPDPELIKGDIAGKTVMVTGAGGSIGSELCRTILRQRPSRLLLVEHNEYSLYAIHAELERIAEGEGLGADVPVPLLISARDEKRISEIIGHWGVETIYHAAAYKHVPLVEQNPVEGIYNNVFGTLMTARAALSGKVRKFVLISTDKAVRPTNVMGASKRLAELSLQALADARPGTCFTMVRFGNVLGSSGSVVPLFRDQIERGGPITITHREINRYFMTIPEAAQLVIQAGAMAKGGEVFVLDMGQPVRIADLARNMIELSGLTIRDEHHPDGDIEIEEVGLRPGEKLYEELLIGDNPEPTDHSRIMKANEEFLPWSELSVALTRMEEVLRQSDGVAAKQMLASLVNGYRPESRSHDWMAQSRAG
jgi:FlaA1/EpsC-like NDP-sugar epimerase